MNGLDPYSSWKHAANHKGSQGIQTTGPQTTNLPFAETNPSKKTKTNGEHVKQIGKQTLQKQVGKHKKTKNIRTQPVYRTFPPRSIASSPLASDDSPVAIVAPGREFFTRRKKNGWNFNMSPKNGKNNVYYMDGYSGM